MKAIELIDQLQNIVDQDGDVDVKIACMGALSVRFVKDKFDVVEAGHEDGVPEIWLETSDDLNIENVDILVGRFIILSEPALVYNDDPKGKYSADPGDFFMVEDDHVFDNQCLTCNVIHDGWSKRIIIKDNPTKKDLGDWEKLAKEALTRMRK